MSRLLALGDVHGCATALEALLAAVALRPDDTLVALGDFVDRGPDSRAVLERIIGLKGLCRLIPLLGNHEQMMLGARAGEMRLWLACGGDTTMASYGARFNSFEELELIPAAHWSFLEDDCIDCYETADHFFVHANADPSLPLDDQPDYMLRWEHLDWPCRHYSGKTMICGHTRQRGGVPLHLGTTVCIDTGAYDRDGWLTCLDVRTGRYWQANQRGETRQGYLDEAVQGEVDDGEGLD
jgi:serine/threonine protein phosphatase 1